MSIFSGMGMWERVHKASSSFPFFLKVCLFILCWWQVMADRRSVSPGEEHFGLPGHVQSGWQTLLKGKDRLAIVQAKP